METAPRLFGSGTAAAGTLLQLAVIAATIPAFPPVLRCLHCHEFEPVLLPGWTPVIENPGSGEWLPEMARCPGRQVAGTSFRLDHAPLPPAFRPFDHKDIVLACVRVDSAGSVRSARLISGTGKAGLDRQLLRTITRQWRFAPMSEVASRPGWQRVRLSTTASYPVI
jgi:TonB family protein